MVQGHGDRNHSDLEQVVRPWRRWGGCPHWRMGSPCEKSRVKMVAWFEVSHQSTMRKVWMLGDGYVFYFDPWGTQFCNKDAHRNLHWYSFLCVYILGGFRTPSICKTEFGCTEMDSSVDGCCNPNIVSSGSKFMMIVMCLLLGPFKSYFLNFFNRRVSIILWCFFVQHCEMAVGVHVPPPSCTSLPLLPLPAL